MDRLKMLEKEGLLKSREGSRAVGKFLQNKLAVVGLIVFALILLSSIFAPLITKYDPAMIDLRS
ncbi:MAG: peptide ABC transporter permease, partial [Limnochordia bacterium]